MTDEILETLTSEEIADLERMFHKRTFEGEEYPINFPEICGFITGIICGPQIMVPPMWISILLGENPSFDTDEQADKFYEYMERIYNAIAEQLQYRKQPAKELFPAHTDFHNDESYDLEAIKSWCDGFYEAVGLVEAWFEIEPFVMMLFPIAAMANAGEGDMWDELLKAEQKTDEELRHTLVGEIGESMFNVYYFVLQMKFGIKNPMSYAQSMLDDEDFEDLMLEAGDDEDDGEPDDPEQKEVVLH